MTFTCAVRWEPLDAILARRRDGATWAELGARYGVTGGSVHLHVKEALKRRWLAEAPAPPTYGTAAWRAWSAAERAYLRQHLSPRRWGVGP